MRGYGLDDHGATQYLGKPVEHPTHVALGAGVSFAIAFAVLVGWIYTRMGK